MSVDSALLDSALIAAFACPLSALEIASHAATSWHSATFSGTRHIVTLITKNGADISIFAQEVMNTDMPVAGTFVPDFAVGACRTDDPDRLNDDVRAIDA